MPPASASNEIPMRQKTENVVYDFAVMGYDELIIKALSGTPTVSSSKLRTNAAEVCTFGFMRYGLFEQTLTIPVAPTAGHVRAWGIKAPALDNRGRCEFEVSGTTFRCVAYDDAGTQILTTTVAWDASWTAAAVRYAVRTIRGGAVQFYINETLVAATAAGVCAPKIPCAIHLNNAVADNVDSTAWMAKDAESLN